MKTFVKLLIAFLAYFLFRVSKFTFESLVNNLYTGSDFLFTITILGLILSLTSSLLLLSYLVWTVLHSLQKYAQLRVSKSKNQQF